MGRYDVNEDPSFYQPAAPRGDWGQVDALYEKAREDINRLDRGWLGPDLKGTGFFENINPFRQRRKMAAETFDDLLRRSPSLRSLQQRDPVGFTSFSERLRGSLEKGSTNEVLNFGVDALDETRGQQRTAAFLGAARRNQEQQNIDTERNLDRLRERSPQIEAQIRASDAGIGQTNRQLALGEQRASIERRLGLENIQSAREERALARQRLAFDQAHSRSRLEAEVATQMLGNLFGLVNGLRR